MHVAERVFRKKIMARLAGFFCLAGLVLCLAQPSQAQGQGAKSVVRLDTSLGTIVLELYKDKAPETVANFLEYVKEGFYEGTVFHRVIKDITIQGGGMDAGMVQRKTRAPIKNEGDNGLYNEPYTVAMARTGDPNSATSQFFINTKDNTALNYKAKTSEGWGYCVFGKVIVGKNVVDKIKAVPTSRRGPNENVPNEPVVILKAMVQE